MVRTVKAERVVLEILEVSQKGVSAHGVNVGARHTFEQLPCTRKRDKGPRRKGGREEERKEQEPARSDPTPTAGGTSTLPPGESGSRRGDCSGRVSPRLTSGAPPDPGRF